MLTVIVPTHNPNAGRLARTLDGLRAQSLQTSDWELLLIDNASARPIGESVDLAWHPRARVVREERLGLTHARLKGFASGAGDAFLMVDDDNVLDVDYLKNCVEILRSHPEIGVFGGKSIPEYETPPPDWFAEVHGPLATADHGDVEQISSWAGKDERDYPAFSPVGAGMCLRRAVVEQWAASIKDDPLRQSLDRTGTSLASAGDNDIVLTSLKLGWSVGYFPQLSLLHLIPSGRLTEDYHARLLEASNRTWVVALGLYGIVPWKPIRPWTLTLRKVRSALQLRPWKGTVRRLRWFGACGQLAGRAELWRVQSAQRNAGMNAS